MIRALQSGLLALQARRSVSQGQTWGWQDDRGSFAQLDLPGKTREALQDLSRAESLAPDKEPGSTSWRARGQWQAFELSRELWTESLAALRDLDPQDDENRWKARWARLVPFREERQKRLDERAAMAGGKSWRQLYAADDLSEAAWNRLTRFLIEPYDDRLFAETEQWRERLRADRDAPTLTARNRQWTAPGVEPISFRRWASSLHPLARAFNSTTLLESISAGPGLSGHAYAEGQARIWREESDSVRGALELSEEFGEALRAQFLLDLGAPDTVLAGDPAQRWASRWLFRRAWDLPEIGAALGISGRPELRWEFLWADAVAPRVIWTYVQEVERLAGNAFDVEDLELSQAFCRAQGFGIAGAQAERLIDEPPRSAALKGIALGLIYEDQLRTRWGNRWYAEKGAVRRVCEYWEAECSQSADSMAEALGVGTIDEAPLVEVLRFPGA